MHGPGWIGGNILDIGFNMVFCSPAKTLALSQSEFHYIIKNNGLQLYINEARPCNLHGLNAGNSPQICRNRLGKQTRVGEMRFGLLGVNHSRVCGQISMRGVARRLDNKPLKIKARG